MYVTKIDNREKDLIKLLLEKGHDMTLENLDLGDIQFVDIDTKEIIIIIERKTLSDLSASIKDGRYKEQKDRLIHSIKKSVRKIVLIEGTDISKFDLPAKTLNSIIINTMIRDNIHIHLTKNLEDTLEFIENILLQIPKYYDSIRDEIVSGVITPFNNENSCHIKKKDNITQNICFRNMLCNIQGVSPKIADIYVNKYKNMENFITSLKKEGDKATIIKILGNEKLGDNKRRIGDKIGEKMYYYIFSDF